MAESFENSTRYITDFMKSLAPEARLQQLPEFTFGFSFNSDHTNVRFDRTEMEDFEVALKESRGTNYFHTLENQIRFRIFVALGAKGLIPDVQISSELLQEKGHWLRSVSAKVAFDTEFCSVLFRGLNLLSASIDRTLASGLELPEVEKEKYRIDGLISFYRENGHLTEEYASMESLSYLKAAAVCVIMEKERARRTADVPRLRKAIDRDIYSIVSKIRNEPFRDIRLPEAIHDYAIQQSGESTPKSYGMAFDDDLRTEIDEAYGVAKFKQSRAESKIHSSLFISYGGPDQAIATAINEYLGTHGVKTWFFPRDALPGQKLHRVMSAGILHYERVLLVCSKSSLSRSGVLNEIERVLEREATEGGSDILIPVTIDDFVLSEWKPSREDVASQVRSRVITTIPHNKSSSEFDDAMEKILLALKKETE